MAPVGDGPVRVVQLSDLHFSTAPGGYMLRDTAETFAAVADHVLADPPDLVVVTGDIANEGKADEYELAGAALADLGLPVYCLAGNHDFVDALHAHLPRPGVVVPRTLRLGEWLFLFGDSNAGGVAYADDDGWLDLPDRVERAKGSLTGHEVSWLRRQLEVARAPHGMLWLHHPPGAPEFFEQPEYDAQIGELTASTTPLRAVAAGHAHTGVTMEVAGVPSYLCPSTGVSVDFEAMTLLPPGYRRFEFGADGSIDAEVVWVEDERWSDRWKLPTWAAEYLAGRLSEEEMRERRAAAS